MYPHLKWLLVVAAAAFGCDRVATPVSGLRLTSTNQSVWAPEVLAQQYERTFTQLADDFRRATNKVGVLAQFPFESIVIPRPDGPSRTLPTDIREQRFVSLPQQMPVTADNSTARRLSHAEWRTALSQFERAGWSLVQAEWHHEQFRPATNSQRAWSQFDFVLHGEQSAESNRFIVRGTLRVEWPPLMGTNDVAKPTRLLIDHLSVLERAGNPGFSDHLVLAPEPERPGGQVNLHPVLVQDLDDDGDPDIVMPSVNKALLNDAAANFTPTSLVSEVHFYAPQNAGVLADFNGDNRVDLLNIAAMGPMTKMLVLTPGTGIPPWTQAPVLAWSAQKSDFERKQINAASVLTAGDIDRDGDLDVFVAQYRPPYIGGQLPTPYYDANDGYPSFLLLNDSTGQFEEAPGQHDLQSKSRRRTMAASLVDLDADHDLDLITINDYSGLDVYLNDGHGTFTDRTSDLPHRHLFGMGSVFADFNQDGALDIFATGMSIPTVHRLDALGLAPDEHPDRTRRRTDMGYGNRLFIRAENRWTNPAWERPLARTGWSWGTAAFDADNNGAVDLYVANGHVSGKSIADYDSRCWTHDIYVGSSNEDPALQRQFDRALKSLNEGQTSWGGYLANALFLDTATNDYRDVAFLFGVAHQTDCRAVVATDLNADGKRDLIVTEAIWMGTPNLMRHRLLVHLNQLPGSNHWVGVRLAGGSRYAVGAKISVTRGARRYSTQIVTGDSYQAQHPAAVQFGLGESPSIDAIEVKWADGQSSQLVNPSADRVHVIRRE